MPSSFQGPGRGTIGPSLPTMEFAFSDLGKERKQWEAGGENIAAASVEQQA
jgi:hypothetical protein